MTSEEIKLNEQVAMILGWQKENLQPGVTPPWFWWLRGVVNGVATEQLMGDPPVYSTNWLLVPEMLAWLQAHCDSFDVCWTKATGWAIWVWFVDTTIEPLYLQAETLPELLAQTVVRAEKREATG